MPAARALAPCPAWRLSITTTRPALALRRKYAHHAPTVPAPTTTTSAVDSTPRFLPVSAVVGGPTEQPVQVPGVHDTRRVNGTGGSTLAPVRLPVELTRRMRIGVDREPAAGLDRQPEQPFGRIEPLRPTVDLHRDSEPAAG